MNNLLDNEDIDDANGRRDREITLGTSTVLGIFFGLAILCAAFFGFGYSLGSKHSTPAVVASGDPFIRSSSTGKPAPGSPINSSAKPIPPGDAVPPSTPPVVTVTKPPAPGAAAPPEAFEPDQPQSKPARNAATPPAVAAPSTAPTAAPAITPGGQFVVQVAALSHQEDADLIASTLEHKGYTVGIHPDPADKLLHVQIGPFATRKDADAMRQKLLADGFNAYIK
jgi:cell division septation protein DedD